MCLLRLWWESVTRDSLYRWWWTGDKKEMLDHPGSSVFHVCLHNCTSISHFLGVNDKVQMFVIIVLVRSVFTVYGQRYKCSTHPCCWDLVMVIMVGVLGEWGGQTGDSLDRLFPSRNLRVRGPQSRERREHCSRTNSNLMDNFPKSMYIPSKFRTEIEQKSINKWEKKKIFCDRHRMAETVTDCPLHWTEEGVKMENQ